MPESCFERLTVFTRYPEPGTTKTRLIPRLGAEGAAELQRRMTERVILKARETMASRSIPVEVRFEGGSEQRMQAWLGPRFSYRPQNEGDIGRRMARAFADGFEDGCEVIVIIGTDIPDITTDIIQRAFDELHENDLVLGPARDGGYYLIGLRQAAFRTANPAIFSGIGWGSDRVVAQTLAVAKKLALRYCLIDTLNDVDRPGDLGGVSDDANAGLDFFAKSRISVIIPTLNEARTIRATLACLPKDPDLEILVVDGGSQDGTAELAGSLGAKILTATPPKARQMNHGAAAATGDVLLFLHADTCLPDRFERQVLEAITQNGFSAGAFKLGIDSDAPGLRIIERVANWRSRFLKMPYGDQALFVSRKIFNEIDGYPDIPIMEDFELIRRLKRKGKIVVLDTSVRTSPRRWQNLGILKTWILNQIIVIAYFLGVSPEQLAGWYHRHA